MVLEVVFWCCGCRMSYTIASRQSSGACVAMPQSLQTQHLGISVGGWHTLLCGQLFSNPKVDRNLRNLDIWNHRQVKYQLHHPPSWKYLSIFFLAGGRICIWIDEKNLTETSLEWWLGFGFGDVVGDVVGGSRSKPNNYVIWPKVQTNDQIGESLA